MENKLEEKSEELSEIKHAIGYLKPNDEYPSWVECQGYWNHHTEVVEWTVEWSEKRKWIC